MTGTSFFLPYNNLHTSLSSKADGDFKFNSPLINNYLAKLNLTSRKVVVAPTAHGNRVARVKANTRSFKRPADGLITNQAGIFLGVNVADCLPVYFYDRISRTCGIAHAGRRGLLGGILRSVVESMQQFGSSNPSDVSACVGPGIGACHYEVNNDVAKQIPNAFIIQRQGRRFANLKALAQIQLIEAGLPASSIQVSSVCTYCEPKLHSYRRDKTRPVKTMLALIGMYA